MRRFLAFANRNRASGSGLPAILAQLNRAVEEADDGDSETAELFVSCVAGVIRQGAFPAVWSARSGWSDVMSDCRTPDPDGRR